MVNDKVILAENKYHMLYGKSVLVALSGGADSVCLLHVLLKLKDEFSIQVAAAHLNHMLRGAESDRDEAFCIQLCRSLGVPLTTRRIDVSAGKMQGESVELAARRMRYEYLNSIPSDVIATAHTADDSLETVLLNLARGTALKGLCGIPPIRDNIIRPLLFCSRKEIEQYCQENELTNVTDSTNFSELYTRNKIRQKIVPVMKEINPEAVFSVTRTTETIRNDAEYLDKVAQTVYENLKSEKGLSVELLNNLHIAVLSRVIVKYHDDILELTPDSFHITQMINLIKNGFGKTGLVCNISAVIADGYFFIETNDSNSDEALCYTVTTELMTKDNFIKSLKINNLLLKKSLDYDKITGMLTLRTRISGDKIKLAGRNGTKELRKLYNEYKVPPSSRDAIPVACDDLGVVWVYSLGEDERVKVDEKTETILVFHVTCSNGQNNLGDVNYVNG